VFYGKIPGINDLVSFDGLPVKELKVSFKNALDDYADTCKTIGKVPDKTYKGTFNVRVPPALHKEASLFAAVNNITLNEFVKTALSFALERKEEINRSIDNDQVIEIT
jgi:predicted HicB family RNase H-like nuclease